MSFSESRKMKSVTAAVFCALLSVAYSDESTKLTGKWKLPSNSMRPNTVRHNTGAQSVKFYVSFMHQNIIICAGALVTRKQALAVTICIDTIFQRPLNDVVPIIGKSPRIDSNLRIQNRSQVHGCNELGLVTFWRDVILSQNVQLIAPSEEILQERETADAVTLLWYDNNGKPIFNMFQNYYLEDISIKRVGNYLYEFFNDGNAPINLNFTDQLLIRGESLLGISLRAVDGTTVANDMLGQYIVYIPIPGNFHL